MVRDQARGKGRAVVNGVAVVGRLSRAQLVTPLPEHVASHALGGERERGLLPGRLGIAAGGRAVYVLSAFLTGRG